MSLLFVGHAVRSLTAATGGVPPRPPFVLMLAVAIGCAAVAVGSYAVRRWPPLTRHVLLVVSIAVTTLLVAAAHRRVDVVLSAFAYPWVALYAAHFISARGAYVYAALTSGAFAVGIVMTGLAGLESAWLIVSGTIAVVTVATSTLVAGLVRQSETDQLTGATNRAGFDRLAAAAIASTQRRGAPLTVVLCDVDGLKQVNDSTGHAAGDALLVDIASSWQPLLPSGGLLARIGGDEFALLLRDSDPSDAEALVSRLRTMTSADFSAGVAGWQPGDGVPSLMGRADAAMYADKRRRRAVRAGVSAFERVAATAAAARR